MQLFTLGLNHQTAPLAIRERVAFHAERLRSALAELTLREPVREAAILSTCNRTEIYCALGEPQAALASPSPPVRSGRFSTSFSSALSRWRRKYAAIPASARTSSRWRPPR